ncbi:hypothetical protein [Geobacter sp.]|uniref:hypothetical protein n=1 Tax=Geobacter sp. TaxID=46610 RepID=UPI001ACC22F6|nr:hypothetical protein [Geobacter sp.]CAG0942185.1 hypothetical protein BROC_01757 [Candidatus Brocadiaceae bacterium]
MEISIPKRRGRPPKKDPADLKASPAESRLLRVIAPPRIDSLLRQMQSKFGYSESEIVRRALDAYLEQFIAKGDIKDL